MKLTPKATHLLLTLWFTLVALVGIVLGASRPAMACNAYYFNFGDWQELGCAPVCGPKMTCEYDVCENCSANGYVQVCELESYCGFFNSCNPCD